MKKQHPAIFVVAFFCLGTSALQAQYYYAAPAGAGPYMRADLGPAFFQDGRLTQFGGPAGNPVNYDNGLAADVAMGYAFNPHGSADLEVGVHRAEIDSRPGLFSGNSALYIGPFLGHHVPVRRGHERGGDLVREAAFRPGGGGALVGAQRVLVLRAKEPDAKRGFRTPLVPFVPIMGVVVSLAQMVSLPFDTWLRLLVWMAIGFVIYFLYSRRHSKVRLAAGTNK